MLRRVVVQGLGHQVKTEPLVERDFGHLRAEDAPGLLDLQSRDVQITVPLPGRNAKLPGCPAPYVFSHPFAVADSLDQRRSAPHGVTAGKNAGQLGFKGIGIGLELLFWEEIQLHPLADG